MKKFLYCCLLSCFALLLSFTTALAASPTINNLRISVEDQKVRVVADASGEVDYASFMLKEPQRVVIDLTDAHLAPTAKKEYDINSPYVKKIRLGQFDKNTVRIVVETKIKDKGYDVFGLPSNDGSYRVVMDFGEVTYSHQNKQSLKSAAKVATNTNNKKVATSVGMSRKKIEAARSTQNTPKSTTPTVAISPVKYDFTLEDKNALLGKKITIDPGHGGSDSGAIGPSGIMEKNVTFKVAMKLAKLLKDGGAKVYLTRKGDNDVAKVLPASDAEELQARVDVANNTNSDVFVSIHIDAFSSPSAQGTSTWYYTKGSEASKALAAAINKKVVANLGSVDRGSRGSNFYVIKHTAMPATLVELGFISNPKEEELLNSDEGSNKAALGIFQGLVNYFSNQGKTE